MRLLLTGADGYLGRHVAAQALALPGLTAMRLTDRRVAGPPADPRVSTLEGDLTDPALRAAALEGADAVIHLAAMLGGAAEAAPEAARRVNLDATLALADACRRGTRFVFASSVAVLGPDLPDPVEDAAPVAPRMVYGAHKAMAEIALATAARRGELDAISLRPSGVVARDGLDAGLKSAFLSRVFHAVRRGEEIALPVGPDARSWLASARVTAANFLHAAALPALPPRRALTLPALAPRMDALVAALRRRFPDGRAAAVSYAPDPAVEAAFGRMPDLRAEAAEAAGFRRDADLDALVRDAFDQNPPE